MVSIVRGVLPAARLTGKNFILMENDMDYEDLHNEALSETLYLLKNDVAKSLEIVKAKYSIGETVMSSAQWDYYNQNLPLYVLENAENSQTIKNFLSDYPVLSSNILETAAKNENVEIEYLSLVLKKQQEELLEIACSQQYSDLLHFILEKDNYLANFQLFDGRWILHYAMQFGTEDIINTLLYYGAIIEAEDPDGKNALHYAALNESPVVWLRYSNSPAFSRLVQRADKNGNYPCREQ